MKTLILKAGTAKEQRSAIKISSKILRQGGIVAFPTETVYGLGANALDSKAVAKIFKAKGRPKDDPLIVHICQEHQLYLLAKSVDARTKLLADKFWPGPLTLVLQKTSRVPKITTGNLNTIAIRMPSGKIAQQLICECNFPIAAPSANLFGKPSPTKASHVLDDLDGKIDAIIDGGKTKIGVESTVLDLTEKVPILLRPGKVTKEQIEKVIGKIKVHKLVKTSVKKGSKKEAARSPGMAYRHYAPRAQVIVFLGKNAKNKIKKMKAAHIGIITIDKNQNKIAKKLYSALREFDMQKNAHITKILVDGSELSESGLGLAVKNRLFKAASKIVK